MAARVNVHKAGADNSAATDQMVSAVAETHSVTDARGRTIVLRKPQVLAQFRLVKVLDPETAQNSAYVQMLFPMLFVVSIDDDPIAFPRSEREVEALIGRLDHEGLTAVMGGMMEHWGVKAPGSEDALKN